MNNLENIAKKIYKEITENKFISKKTLKYFEALNRNDGRKILQKIIEMEKNFELKEILMKIYEINHYVYDKRLFISAIWAAFNTFV